MVEFNCTECKELINISQSRIDKNKGKAFCSGKCSSKYMWKNSKIRIKKAGYTSCNNCGHKIYRPAGRVNKNCYCNCKCQMQYEYKTGKRDKFETTKKANESLRKRTLDRFNKGQVTRYINKRGYWVIHVPVIGKTLEHRYVWEQQHGKIPEDGQIHHINGDKLDNRIENLQLFASNSEHVKFHNEQKKRNSKGRFLKKAPKEIYEIA